MSTITKEWLQQKIADMEATRDEIPFGLDEDDSNTLAALRIAQASLEAEPVAYADPQAFRNFQAGVARREWMWRNPGEDLIPVYTAPPVPVSVPDERYQNLSELYHAQENRLFKLAQRIKGPSFDKYAHSPSQAIDVLESAIFGEREEDCRAAMLQGAEPVTTAYKLRDAVEIIRNSGIEIDAEKIFAERDVLNTPDCWCRTCRPVTVTDMRFVVCPDCGNKRCPHANDHRNACTGSNEPGQEGSAYPAAPQKDDE